MEFPQPTEQGFRRPGLSGLVDSYSYSFLESRVTLCSYSLFAFHNRLYSPEVLLQRRGPQTHPDLAIPQIAKHRSSLVCICSVDCLSLVISLPGHGPDYFVYLFGVLVVIISLKAGDLASKLGFDDCYCYLPPVRDV
jgi:hypothetical protein